MCFLSRQLPPLPSTISPPRFGYWFYLFYSGLQCCKPMTSKTFSIVSITCTYIDVEAKNKGTCGWNFFSPSRKKSKYCTSKKSEKSTNKKTAVCHDRPPLLTLLLLCVVIYLPDCSTAKIEKGECFAKRIFHFSAFLLKVTCKR